MREHQTRQTRIHRLSSLTRFFFAILHAQSFFMIGEKRVDNGTSQIPNVTTTGSGKIKSQYFIFDKRSFHFLREERENQRIHAIVMTWKCSLLLSARTNSHHSPFSESCRDGRIESGNSPHTPSPSLQARVHLLFGVTAEPKIRLSTCDKDDDDDYSGLDALLCVQRGSFFLLLICSKIYPSNVCIQILIFFLSLCRINKSFSSDSTSLPYAIPPHR